VVEQGRVAPGLRLCRGCRQFVRLEHEACPFCGGDLDALAADYEARQADLQRAADALREALARLG
jgi:predicted amidophosphoribosyltransferase